MKTIFRGLSAVLGLFLLFIGIRAATFTAPSPTIDPPYTPRLEDDAALRRLATALSIPTVTTSEPPQYRPESFAALRRHLRESFPLAHTRLSTETVGQHSLLFTWKGSDPQRKPILLMAHQDVVPIDPGTETRWTHPPFGGVVKDGFVWGRGSLDVKNGVVAILEATEALLSEGFAPKRTIYLAFGHDEEIGGSEGASQIAQTLQKRGVRLQFTLDEGGIIVSGAVPSVTNPVALVGVAEKGYLSLKLVAEHPGGHSSMPPPQTAVGILSQAINRLEQSSFPARLEQSRTFFSVVGPQMTFGYRLVFANYDLFAPVIVKILSSKPSTNATIRTTIAATMFHAGAKDNVLPARAEAVVNFRVMPGDTLESIQAYVQRTIDDPRVRLAPYQEGDNAQTGMPASTVSASDGPDFAVLKRSILQATQDPTMVVAPFLFVGFTDARYFAKISENVYRFQPIRLNNADLARIHGTDERLATESYLEAIRFYYTLIRNAT